MINYLIIAGAAYRPQNGFLMITRLLNHAFHFLIPTTHLFNQTSYFNLYVKYPIIKYNAAIRR